MATISHLSLARNSDPEQVTPKNQEELHEKLLHQAVEIADFAMHGAQGMSFMAFERSLGAMVFALARTAVVLFLVVAEKRVCKQLSSHVEKAGQLFRRCDPQARNLATWFGVVRYWRTYMRTAGRGKAQGFFPLDVDLGLTAERVSMSLLSTVVRLATKMSYAEARLVVQMFLPTVPSTEVIENAVLGFGRYTAEWFESAPAPDGDGDVLIVMIDSKGAPTATDQELKRRRGKRKKRPHAPSPRHRGRKRRKRHGRKQRRKKGDKSKNAKMATLVVMYTLRRDGKLLLGPINRWVYGSFAPKKHAFAIARREANKRGFTPESGKLIQLVTDGDNDLACYATKYFPDAIHTVDVMHVIEKLWSAGECIHREASDALRTWVEEQKERLYGGKVDEILDELQRHLDATPKTGPGNKGKRQRLNDIIRYLTKRVDKMNYDELIAQDLEIGSGAVEGAVKHVIGKRCDYGGMRWIKERAEAVLQLRCIEINGDWERFVQRVHDTIQRQGLQRGERIRLQQRQAAPLPEFTEIMEEAA